MLSITLVWHHQPVCFFRCDSAPHSPGIISVHRSPTLHARYHPTSDPFHFHPAGLTFPPSSVRRADLPIMIGSSLPVAPLLSNPPARSILSTQTSNHPSHVLVPPYSGCRAAVCSLSLHLPNPLDLWCFDLFLTADTARAVRTPYNCLCAGNGSFCVSPLTADTVST